MATAVLTARSMNEKPQKEPLVSPGGDIEMGHAHGHQRCDCKRRQMATVRTFAAVIFMLSLAAIFLTIVSIPWCEQTAPSSTAFAQRSGMYRTRMPHFDGMEQRRFIDYPMDARD